MTVRYPEGQRSFAVVSGQKESLALLDRQIGLKTGEPVLDDRLLGVT